MPVTANKGYSVQNAGDNPGTWGAGTTASLNTGMIQILDQNMGGVIALSLSNVDVTMTATQAQNCTIRLTGTLTGNVTVTNPNIGFYFVENLTSGSFTVTITNGVAGTTVSQGDRVCLFADTTYGVRKMVPASVSTPIPDLTNTNTIVTANYTVSAGDIRSTLSCGGNSCYTISFPAASGFSSTFAVRIANTDFGRAKIISCSGQPSTFFLWPQQSCTVYVSNNQWAIDPEALARRYRPPSGGGTIFVDPINGNAANDGLAAGLGGALDTIQHAYDRVYQYWDMGSSGAVTIRLAAGSYNVGAGVNIIGSQLGADLVHIIGDAANPSSYVIQCTQNNGYCFFARDQGIVSIQGVKFQQSGVIGPTAVSATQGSVIDIANCVFDNFGAGIHMNADTWASVNVIGDYSVIGTCSTHIRATNGGYINYGSFTVNITTPITVTQWASASNCGVINAGGVPMTFTGSTVTGLQYAVAYNGVIIIGGATYPGNGGSASTGGQVSP